MDIQPNQLTSSKVFATAKWFIEHGYSIIPIRANKKSFVKWKEYQERIATHEEIKLWWTQWPEANIALVTGKISGIIVIDIDSQEGYDNLNEFLPDSFVTPMSTTPNNGWHYFVKYQEGLINKARVVAGTDIRTDGGYAIIPPSQNGKGKSYKWIEGLKINEVAINKIPSMLFDILSSVSSSVVKCRQSCETENNSIIIPYNSIILSKDYAKQQNSCGISDIDFTQGNRDESLFHTANCLIKGGMNTANTKKCLEILGRNCNPPFDEKEIEAKVISALNRSKKPNINLTQEIKEWILTTSGDFLTTFVYTEFNLTTRDDKKTATRILCRLCEDGMIERSGRKRGCYRTVEKNLEFLDIVSANREEEKLWLPLGIDKMVRLFPGNIVVVAGAPNSGKTAFLLAVVRRNFRNFRVRYLSSEMGREEAGIRIDEFDDITREEWQKNWEFAERYDNFHDCLLSGRGNLNIIDYLEQPEGEAFRASTQLAEINKRLNGAIAIVALQKNRGRGREVGVGGDQTLAKPRLYIAMDYGWAKIIKCKAWPKEAENPNWKSCGFKLGLGHHFIMQGTGWAKEQKEQLNEKT